MLTAVEAQETYTALVQIANEAGLSWLVHQVEEEIKYGRIRSDIKAKVAKADQDSEPPSDKSKSPGRSTTFVGAEEFSYPERIRMLARAIRTVAQHSLDVEEAVIRFFSESGSHANVRGADTVTFSDGQVNKSLSLDGVAARRQTLPRLLILLNELEGEA